ncbi:MAG: hypothetical protein AABO58_00920 [Acidobacteriota bacterium]
MRFGAGHVLALVLLELGLTRRMDGWDTEWYEGEVLRRLRARLFAHPVYKAFFPGARHRRPYEDRFDWLANTYQTDAIDLDAVLIIGKRRYYRLLLAVLRSIYREEGITGEVTADVLRRYRFSRREIRFRGLPRSTGAARTRGGRAPRARRAVGGGPAT